MPFCADHGPQPKPSVAQQKDVSVCCRLLSVDTDALQCQTVLCALVSVQRCAVCLLLLLLQCRPTTTRWSTASAAETAGCLRGPCRSRSLYLVGPADGQHRVAAATCLSFEKTAPAGGDVELYFLRCWRGLDQKLLQDWQYCWTLNVCDKGVGDQGYL